MRNTSEEILCEDRLMTLFLQLPDKCTFHEDDVAKVFGRYVARSERMFGKEFERNFTEQELHNKSHKNRRKTKCKKKPENKFEQLRVVKRKKKSKSKLVNTE